MQHNSLQAIQAMVWCAICGLDNTLIEMQSYPWINKTRSQVLSVTRLITSETTYIKHFLVLWDNLNDKIVNNMEDVVNQVSLSTNDNDR